MRASLIKRDVMEARPGEFGWSHTEAEIQAAMKEGTGSMDDEEPNYNNDFVVTQHNEQLMLAADLSKKKGYRRPSKSEIEADARRSFVHRRSIQQRMSLIRTQIETSQEELKENTEEKEEIRLETIAREGLKALYERQLNVGKGIQRGPYIVPYKFLGTPDLKRDDSLLPKTFQFAKREKFPTSEVVIECSKKQGNQPMVLPLELRAAYWNGGRWCGTSSTANQVSMESGFGYLYQEVVESEKRRVNCKGGKYFLSPREYEFANSASQEEGTKPSFVSEFTPRQQTRRPSVAKPFIPPLPLKDLPKFDLDEQLNLNEEILSAYRGESTYREELAAERAKSPKCDKTESERKKEAMFGTNGFPLKACENSSLRQLENILQSKASFRAMQHDLNSRLVHSLKAMQTARPYHYAREFNLKGGGHDRPKIVRDLAATPRRANALRAHMQKCGWFENLVGMVYLNGRHPTKTELLIVNNVRRVMDQDIDYGLDEYTRLIQRLGDKKMDMDTSGPQKALIHIKTSLQLDDIDLLTNLISSRSKLPAFLERKTNLVKQVIRDLESQKMQQSQWTDKLKDKTKLWYRPKNPPSSKLRKLVPSSNQQASSKKPQSFEKAQTARF